MASIPGTVGLTGIIAPKDEQDTYAVQEDIWGKGGFRVADDITMRDAITEFRRKAGMLVHVLANQTTYQLQGGITNNDWVIYTAGGSGGSDLTYVHTQAVANVTWDITHGLGKRPSITIVDSSDDEVVGDVTYVDNNSVQLTFSAAFSGKAYLN